MAITLNSDKSSTTVPGSTKPLYTSTRTTYNVDSNGKIDPKSVKHELLYYDAPLSPRVVAATSTGTSNDWTFANKPLSSTPYLGADAQKSLREGALKNTTQQQIQTAATKGNVTPDQQRALSTKQLNTAPPQAGDGTQPISLDIQGSGGQRDSKDSFGVHVYPLTLRQSHQDTVKFTMLKYEPRKFQTGQGNLGGFSERSTNRTTLGTVVLPVPSGISETNGVEWGQDKMDPGQALLANMALTGITKGLGAMVDEGSAALETASKSGDAKVAVAAGFAQAASQVGGLLTRTQGAVLNPNMELLFQGPTLRPFSFSFKMSARSSAEAKAIIRIIRFFKQGMSPQKSQSNLFLKAPHTFKIQYMYGSKEHPYIGQIKECGLQNLAVNYTPEGQYATYHDGPMVSYEIQMTFQELEPVFNEDYGNQGNTMPSDLLFRESQPSTKP